MARPQSGPDFRPGGDTVRYRVPLAEGVDSVEVTVALLYQTIGYRWAQNLEAYDALESRRFVGYYRENAAGSAVVLAEAAGETGERVGGR